MSENNTQNHTDDDVTIESNNKNNHNNSDNVIQVINANNYTDIVENSANADGDVSNKQFQQSTVTTTDYQQLYTEHLQSFESAHCNESILDNKDNHNYNDIYQWYKQHIQHCIILNSISGKPIWTRYGDIYTIHTLTALISTIVHNIKHNTKQLQNSDNNSKHSNKQVYTFTTNHNHYIILDKTPFIIVTIIRHYNDSSLVYDYNLPLPVYEQQCNVVYKSLIFLLTYSITSILHDHPNYDIQPILHGTEIVLYNVCNRVNMFDNDNINYNINDNDNNIHQCIHRIHQSSYDFLTNSIYPVPMLTRPIKQQLSRSMKYSLSYSSHSDNSIYNTLRHTLIYSILCVPQYNIVINIVRGLDYNYNYDNNLHSNSNSNSCILYPRDLILLFNFIQSNISYKQHQHWLPICLPSYDKYKYIYLYLCYITDQICLCILTSDATQFNVLHNTKHILLQQYKYYNNILHTMYDIVKQPFIDIHTITSYICSKYKTNNTTNKSRITQLFNTISLNTIQSLYNNTTTTNNDNATHNDNDNSVDKTQQQHNNDNDIDTNNDIDIDNINNVPIIYHMLYHRLDNHQSIMSKQQPPFNTYDTTQMLYKLYADTIHIKDTYWHNNDHYSILYLYVNNSSSTITSSSYQAWFIYSPFTVYDDALNTSQKAVEWIHINSDDLFL